MELWYQYIQERQVNRNQYWPQTGKQLNRNSKAIFKRIVLWRMLNCDYHKRSGGLS